MVRAVEILQWAGGAAFVLLALANAAMWRRTGQSRSLDLALAMGSLGLVSFVDRASAGTGYRVQWLVDLEIVLLLFGAYRFLKFRAGFVSLERAGSRFALAAVVGAAGFAVAARIPGGPSPELSAVQSAALVALMAVWSSCMLEPIVRFLVAARRLPRVQRSRLRALSVGYAAVVAIVVGLVAFSPASRHPAVTAAGYAIGLAFVPVIYAGFAPPGWLRRIWRQREEDELLAAAGDLTGFLDSREEAASRGLLWGVRLLGGHAGFVADRDGNLLASAGLDRAQAEMLAANVRADDRPSLTRLPDRQHTVTAPLVGPGGTLAVIGGPYTPLFGSDEVTRLGSLGVTIGTALERVALAEELSAEKARYETLMHAISDAGEGVVVAEGTRLVYANPAYLSITGFTFEELAAMESLLDLATEDQRPGLIDQYIRRKAGEDVPDHFETALVRKDGARIEIEVALKELRHDGRLQTVTIVRDITERKRAQQALARSEEQLAAAQEIAGLGSWSWDVAADELTWSEELYRIFALDPATFRPTFESYMARIHPEDQGAVQAAVGTALVGGESYAFDHRVVLPSGSIRTLHCKGDVEVNEHLEPVRLHGTAQDVTDRVRAEETLRESYEREREAAERLRSVDTMKNAFLTAVSHELRTPLTAVLGFAKTLEQRETEVSPAERRVFLRRLAANAEKLDRLLSDLLDVDRLTRGMLEPIRRPMDLGALVRHVAGDGSLLQGRPVHLDAPAVTISADAAKVERILENLIRNAIRHTPEGTPIWVRVEPFEEGALLVVEDAGSGVPEDMRDSVFEPFRQGPTVASHSPGVGIGLSLVFGFAALHGGRAWVEDRPGGGASFKVYLPDVPAGTPALSPPVHAAAGGLASE